VSLSHPVLVVGGGAVARALVRALAGSARLNAPIRIWARNPEQAKSIANAFDGPALCAVSDLSAAASGVGTIVICVSDDAIEQVASLLAGQLRQAASVTALHMSGYLGVAALAPLSSAGFETGAMHPIASIAMGSPQACFEGVYFGVSGSPSAMAEAEHLVDAIGGRAVSVKDAARGLYHGAAALLSGGVVALFAEAQRCLSEALGDTPEGSKNKAVARAILLGLLESTTENLSLSSPMNALTGPLSRGDHEVVKGHALAFEEANLERASKLHALLLETMVELVELRRASEK
jgi:predicted short-subunit dehydrogenase-like oxidoreductase (DUF2520 family)